MALERFNFSSDFQDLLLACMCRFPERFVGIDTVLNYSYFTGINSANTAKLSLAYYKENAVFPGFTALGQLAVAESRKSSDGDFSHDLGEYVKKLSEINVRDVDFVRKSVVRFAQERALLIAAGEVGKLVQEGKEATIDLVEKFQTALSLGQNLEDMGLDAKDDAYAVLQKLLSEDYGISTGYEVLDTHAFKKGFGPGWLVVPLAPPKAYKTTFCLNLATNIAGPGGGHDVVYYSCEISSELALLRTYLRIVQKTEDELYADPRTFYEELVAGLEINLPGRMIVKHFPAKSVTINDIRAHLKALIAAKGIKPRAVFIDYADTIKPEDGKQPEHRRQSEIYTSARALAEEFKCVVIMPDRCNRETVEQVVPTMTSFQGAFEKAGIVDVGIGLCATPDEIRQGIMRFFLFLYRHGEAGLHFKGTVDAKRATISVNEKLEWNDLMALEGNAEDNRARGGRKGGAKPRRRRQPEGAIEG